MRTKIICFFLFVVAIIIVRILDFTMMWSFMSPYYYKNYIIHNKNHVDEEKLDKKISQEIYFKEIGFCSRSKANIILDELEGKREEAIIIVSYFDFFHPLVYLIKNKGEKIDTYRYDAVWTIDKGLMEIFFYKEGRFKILSNKNLRSILQIFILGDNNSYSPKENKDYSFVIGPDYTDFSAKVLFFYSYLPFLFILIISIMKDKTFLLSYFYYFEMIFFLGDIRLFTLSGIFNHLELSSFDEYWCLLMLLTIFLLFIIGAYFLIKKKKDSISVSVRNTVIAFFIFLPFLLWFSYILLDRVF